nr:DUF4902 domain-containing protein [Acidovorax sp. sic0104]
MIGVSRKNNDYYVRIPAQALNLLGLTHHSTEITCSRARSGFTQWVASHPDALLVVSWDWIRLDDGAILHPCPRVVLSNLMLLNDDALDLGCGLTELALLRLVDRLDWKPAVFRTCDRFVRGLSEPTAR